MGFRKTGFLLRKKRVRIGIYAGEFLGKSGLMASPFLWSGSDQMESWGRVKADVQGKQ